MRDRFAAMSLRRYYEDPYEHATSATCSEPPVIDVVIKMLDDYKGQFQTLLDVGCGANLLYNLPSVERGVAVTGVDFAYNFLRLAPRHNRITLAQVDVEQLAFVDSSFDAAVCSETAEHVPGDDKVISEIHRILKHYGLLFFTVPNLWNAARLIDLIKQRKTSIEFLDHGHLREYTRSMVNKLIKPLFTIERFYPVPFNWHGLIGSPIDSLISHNLTPKLSKSIALVARKRSTAR